MEQVPLGDIQHEPPTKAARKHTEAARETEDVPSDSVKALMPGVDVALAESQLQDFVKRTDRALIPVRDVNLLNTVSYTDQQCAALLSLNSEKEVKLQQRELAKCIATHTSLATALKQPTTKVHSHKVKQVKDKKDRDVNKK